MATQGTGRRVANTNTIAIADLQLLRLIVCAMLGLFLSISFSQATTYVAGDLAPRNAPDEIINAADLVMLQRIINDQIIPTDYELLVGDVALLEGELTNA